MGEERGELGGRGDGALLLLLLDAGGQSGGARADHRLAHIGGFLVLLREGVRAVAATALSNHLTHCVLEVVVVVVDWRVFEDTRAVPQVRERYRQVSSEP